MTSTSRGNSGRDCRFALLLLLACFANDWMMRSRLRMEAFDPPWRFSAWLRWSCRRPQLGQKGRHGSANLCQGQDRSAMFPRPVHPFDQGTSKYQLVVRARHDLRPAFGLLWSAKTWDI